LRGIFDCLAINERMEVNTILRHSGCRHDRNGFIIDSDLPIVQEVMVKLGHIISFEVNSMESGAEEYDEIMRCHELIREE